MKRWRAGPIALLLWMGLGTLIAVNAAPRPKDNFDPKVCKTDPGGSRWVAVGRYVLKVPINAITMGRRPDPKLKEYPFVPPDPTDPAGCPGNPEQYETYGFVFAVEAVQRHSGRGPSDDHLGIDELTLVSHERRDLGRWNSDTVDETMAQRICAKYPGGTPLSNGLRPCGIKPQWDEKTPDTKKLSMSFITGEEGYRTPRGEPFAVNCLYGSCSVSYSLMPKLSIWYQFHVRGAVLYLPITETISFDKLLRTLS